jgi:hypothetical protein
VLRILPEQRVAMALMTNSSTGRAMYRSLFTEVMDSPLGVTVSPLRLTAAPGAAGDLDRFAGVYAWPDRRAEVTATSNSLLIKTEEEAIEALPIDERTFLIDSADPDNPTVTFGAFDATGRPYVLYFMLWNFSNPRLSTSRGPAAAFTSTASAAGPRAPCRVVGRSVPKVRRWSTTCGSWRTGRSATTTRRSTAATAP